MFIVVSLRVGSLLFVRLRNCLEWFFVITDLGCGLIGVVLITRILRLGLGLGESCVELVLVSMKHVEIAIPSI